jgi:hypothetical protein
MDAMKQTIVYILSTPFAGSHFLSLMLGSNSRTRHIGELNLLAKKPSERALIECELKRGHVLDGIGKENIHDAYTIIFSRIPNEVSVLIDASKRVSWARRFVGDDGYARKYVHLIRDPRALVRRYGTRSYFPRRFGHRWKLFRAFAASRPDLLFASHPVLRRYYWLMQNQEITRFVEENRLDHTVVTYHDLATNPGAEVQRVMEWLEAPYEPAQLEYWNFEHIGTEKKAYEWVKEKKEMFIDLRWKTELPGKVQQAILEDRGVNDYLGKIRLKYVENGLTRMDSSRQQAPRNTS